VRSRITSGRDEVADRLGLRLGERRRTAVGRVGRVVARPGPAPQRPVVAVQVDAEAEAARRCRRDARARRLGLAVDIAAVLALVGVAGGAEDDARVVGDAPGAAQVDDVAAGAGGVVAVGVRDRDDDRPAAGEQVDDASVVGVRRVREAVDEVVGELHGELGRGPLPGVVGAEHEEHRPAILGLVHPDADLDAGQVTALDALAMEIRFARSPCSAEGSGLVGFAAAYARSRAMRSCWRASMAAMRTS
jgi:hypothetical protein